METVAHIVLIVIALLLANFFARRILSKGDRLNEHSTDEPVVHEPIAVDWPVGTVNLRPYDFEHRKMIPIV